MTYCGVNAHFQNGVAEKHIRDLQERERTMLLFAVHKWPRMISMAIWPYALRTSNEVRNATPFQGQTKTPLELFAQVAITPNLKHFHNFGCPTYILDNKLQGNKAIQKWQARSQLGIYLGPSPNHSRSISLILNPCTGHTSPQYHVKHDDFFETVHPGKTTNFDAPHPEWKYLARVLHQEQSTQSKEGQCSLASPDKALKQVSEGAQNKPSSTQTSIPPTQLEINETIEEQANPRVVDPPQQQPQEQLLQLVPVVPPVLQEENQPTTRRRSG